MQSMWYRETHSSQRGSIANKKAGANPQSNADRDAWNRAFHGKMNDLARTTGVCSRTNN